MALSAQIVGIPIELEEMLETRSVGTVATQTIKGQIRVARIDHFCADGMGRVSLPLMALATDIEH